MRYTGMADEMAYYATYGGPNPMPSIMSDDEGDYRADLMREADLLDDGAPRVREPIWREACIDTTDCRTCLAVAGQHCRDWKLNPHTWNWYGTQFVREFAHIERGAPVELAA